MIQTLKFLINEKKIKLIRPIVFFVGFSLMSSCSPDSVDENYQIVTFTEKDISKSTQLKSKTYRDSSIFMPKMIKLVDDGKLILIDQERDTIIHVFGFSDSILVHENSFGIEGQGPGELGQITDLYRANEPNHFWVQQMAMKKMSLFSSNQSTLYPVQEIDAAQGKLFNAICMTPATDSTFMCTMYGSGVKFTEVDLEGNVLNEYGHWRQNSKRDYEEVSYLDMFMGRMTTKNGYFLISTSDIDHLELLNAKTGKIISVRGPVHHEPKYSINENGQAAIKRESWFYMYIRTQITDQHIYASFENGRGGSRETFPKRILKFSLNGDIREEFVLDQGVHYFQVDEANNKLYGLSHDVEGAILVFDLPY